MDEADEDEPESILDVIEPEKHTQLEVRLKLALIVAHNEFVELEQFAGTTEVMRPIVRGQSICRWDLPDWAERMAEIEAEIAQAKAEAAAKRLTRGKS